MRVVLVVVALFAVGCSSTGGTEPPSATRFEQLAADIVPQIAPQDLAVAIARPVVTDARTGSDSSLKRAAERRAEHYSDKLLAAMVRAKNAPTLPTQAKVRFLTREHLLLLLEEQGLQWSDLLPTDPKTRVKLKTIRAVQAYVVWRIEVGKDFRDGRGTYDYEDWTLMVISVQTGEILAASKAYRHWLT